MNDVHLWYLMLSDVADPVLAARYAALLSDEERRRHARYATKSAAARYLLTRALVRSVLSHYAATEPAAWVFAYGPHGKPCVAAPDQVESEGISFSVSHTDSIVVMAVTSGRRVGVDAEVIKRQISHEVTRRALTSLECAELEQLPEQARGRRFLELWTLKESWLKAVGTGLDFPPRRLQFLLDSHPDVAASMEMPPTVAFGAWQFQQVEIAGHIVAICSEQADAVRLRCLRTVPLVDAAEYMPTVLRFTQRATQLGMRGWAASPECS